MAFGFSASWPEFKKEMDRYQAGAGVDQSLIRFYVDLFKIWHEYRERIHLSLHWEPEEMKEAFRRGSYLLHGKQLPVDAAIYRGIMEKIVDAMNTHYPDTAALKKLLELPATQVENLEGFLVESVSFDGEKMVKFIEGHRWDEAAGVESDLAAFIMFAALTPFYLSLAAAAAPLEGLSLWQHGFCPLCGQKPGMALIRQEDSARILECWLCHTRWQFPRLECPYCANKDFNELTFFYIEELPGRRVQLCGCCKSYLKTAVIKEIGHEVILELENIFTIQLDLLARREGYQPGEDLALLS